MTSSQSPPSAPDNAAESWQLEDILATEALTTRPSHTPNYKGENEALVSLAKHMAEHSDNLLQKLVEAALELCSGESAGISIEDEEEQVFRWQAIEGAMKPFLGGTMPRDYSPCGVTVDTHSLQLMVDPIRYYPYISALKLPVREVLLVPFYREGRAIGTVWIISHTKTSAFDAEDARLLTSLAQFASMASDALMQQTQAEQTRRELQEVQTKLEAALQAGSIATWSWDIGNDRVFADSYCAELFAISEQDARGGPISKYIDSMHPDDRVRVSRIIQAAMESGITYEVEYRLRSTEGWRWVIARGKVLRDATGKAVQFPGVIVDITTRKEAQLDVEARQRELWSKLPVACYTLDTEGYITFYNEAATRLWGRSPEIGQDKWCGSHCLMSLQGDVIPAEDSPAAQALREKCAVCGVELHVVRPDGSRRWITPHADPIFDPSGTFLGLINVLNDVTEERVSIAALREARDQAVAASRAKDDFLAALSHELRTPLNPVLLLASDAADNPTYSTEIRSEFEVVRRNIELEARLIDDLLDVTRISRGKLKLDCSLTDLHAVLKDAKKKVETDADEKKLKVTWDLKAKKTSVYGDPVRLQQVFWNVLKNAVKFTPPEGCIHISSTDAPDGQEVQVKIQDTGIGIRTEDLSGIFDAFTQGSPLESHNPHLFGGLGLGLAISQQVMKLHQGRITAESPGEGKGACFTIEIPVTGLEGLTPKPDAATTSQRAKTDLQKKPGTAVPKAAHTTASTKGRRILIIEDHVPSRVALQRLLNRRGHQVVPAGSGEEACREVAAARFDLAICDIGLPDTDGYTLVQELLQRQPGLPVIAMTGYGTESDVRKAELAGFVSHLTKPVSVAQLDEVLKGIAEDMPDSK